MKIKNMNTIPTELALETSSCSYRVANFVDHCVCNVNGTCIIEGGGGRIVV